MKKFILWGVGASPYQLKMQSLLDFTGHDWERWPQQAGRRSGLSMALRLAVAKHRGKIQRFPAMSAEFDEYPAVPFYTSNGTSFYYDSSSMAYQLDQDPQRQTSLLIPQDPKLAFICQLIDEAFDEFGLYMVHHMRWVGSAQTTPMGQMTAQEFRRLLPPGGISLLARRLYRRQVARCPYLFSVAPRGYDAGVAKDRTPPSRLGFPPTHALLDEAWRRYLAAMEHLLSNQPYLLGGRFTLADASVYGQLGMNLVDPQAIAQLELLAPRTFRWLCAIREGRQNEGCGDLALTPSLEPLLRIIMSTFGMLMRQNEKAYEHAVADGETVFNEAAFDRHRALYDGHLLGYPFRAVAKTFQVRVWRELKESWQALEAQDRESLEQELLPDAGIAFSRRSEL
ncbi:MAG: glutathione S-transferase C-terminal domain-containing protein [Halioglobus sp.]